MAREAETLAAGADPPPPLRVEQALRLIPEVELLAPLRALLLASSRQAHQDQWASSSPYLTIGKRLVQTEELERRMPEALEQARQHLAHLYRAVVRAVDAEQRGETGAAVTALLEAGEREENIGRPNQARAWYEAAQVLSEGLVNRLPELGALNRLGRLELDAGHFPTAARYYQRALALAEAASAPGEAIDACQGLGAVAHAEGNLFGAQAWYQRGLHLARQVGDPLRISQAEHHLGLVALARSEFVRAGEYLDRAREGFERLGASLEMARTMNSQGQLDAVLGRLHRTSGAYLEALAWCRRSGGAPDLEVTIRLNLAELYLVTDRVFEAEEEARRGEQVAITQGLPSRLVGIYLFLGRLRGTQGDEAGFVFFEKALELCRELSLGPDAEGRAYHQYASFRSRLGQAEEARALLERAGEVLGGAEMSPLLTLVREDLDRLGDTASAP